MTEARNALDAEHGVQRPMLVKIAPDWTDEALIPSLEVIAESSIDGLIATNTTLARDAVAGSPHAAEGGGLSGAPLLDAANHVLARAREVLGPDRTIIGLGGITRPEDARAKREAGADLVQLYTGFIYHGPALVRACARALAEPGHDD